MKHVPSIQGALFATLLAAPRALAQTSSAEAVPPFQGGSPATTQANRFGLSYRMGFNVPVSFKNLGGFAPLSANGNTYNYDNGYVFDDGYGLVDGSGKSVTTYYGYAEGSRISDHAVVMQKSWSEATADSNNHYDSPMSGVELTYNREFFRKQGWRAGLEGAFGYTFMAVRDVGRESADVTRLSNTYEAPQFGGIRGFLPDAPFFGPQRGVPSLVASPSSTMTEILPGGAWIAGQRDFNADMFSFRFGPYVEIPLSQSIVVTLSGGFALMYVSSEFSFNDTVAIAGVGSVPQVASGWGNAWLPGGYIAGNFMLALNKSWSLVAGAQFENLGTYTQKLRGKEATLDLSRSVFVSLGLSYSF